MMKHSAKPIKSKKEADQVMEYLAKSTAKVYNVSHEEALRRVKAMMGSGLLDHPEAAADNPKTQRAIELFLSLPSETYAD